MSKSRKPAPAQTANAKTTVITGRLPSLGNIHRLTITGETMTIERTPVVSAFDGTVTTYPKLFNEDVSRHFHLIDMIKNNPAEWPE